MMSKTLLVTLMIAYVEARFGQEQVPIAAISAVQGGAAGAAATIAGATISDLLGAANACAKLARADQIVTELGGGADAIAAAKGLVAAEKNTNPFANGNAQNVCGDATLPATTELRGITPLIDPAVDTAGGVAALSQQTQGTPLDATGKSVFDLLSEAGFGDLVVSQNAAGGAAAGGAQAGNNAAAGGAQAGNNAAAGNANQGNAAAGNANQNQGNATAGNNANQNQQAKGKNNGKQGKAKNKAKGKGKKKANAGAAAGAGNNNAAAGNQNAGNGNQMAGNNAQQGKNNAGNAGAGNANAGNNANQNAGNNAQQGKNNAGNAGAGNANAGNNNANQNAGNNAQQGKNNAGNAGAGNANAGAAAGGAADFGACAQPTITFQGGEGNRPATEFTFQIADATARGGQGEALNPNIITNALCNNLTNFCKANAAAIAKCEDAKAQVQAAGTRDKSTADLFNTAIGFAGAVTNPAGGPENPPAAAAAGAARKMRRGMRSA